MRSVFWLLLLRISLCFSIGIIFPLYVFPWDPAFDTVIDLAIEYPNVPFIVIPAMPSNMSSSVFDPVLNDTISRMQKANIRVLYYVFTDGGLILPPEWTDSIRQAKQQYQVNGVFFDSAPAERNWWNYYAWYADLVHTMNLSLAVANPGEPVWSFHDTPMDIICMHEGYYLPRSEKYRWPKQKIYVIAYNTTFDTEWVQESKDSVGWMYISDSDYTHTTLPTYLEYEISTFSAINNQSSSDANVLKILYEQIFRKEHGV